MAPPRPPLPIDAVVGDITAALRGANAVVVRAPTGAGKTTRVPLALLEAGLAGDGKILLIEPRRVAARAAARRMASELGESLGETVGYRVRFDRRVSRATRIEAVTEGVLLRRLQSDPFLEGISVIVFDEVHERSVDTEVAIAMAHKVGREARDDLRLVAMSATLDAPTLARFLDDAPIVTSEGRLHPVDVKNLAASSRTPLDVQVRDGVDRALAETTGDVLVFLPGLREIREAKGALGPRGDARVLELYGDLPPEAQDAVLESGGQRRVILATNVAESSITIEGVTAVVDSGLVRQLCVDPSTGLNRLETTRVSRASADQRSGRAGRLGPGVAYRLYSSAEDRALDPHETPEIARVDLTAVALQLRAWGEVDLHGFGWLTPPPTESLDRALDTLALLGAVTATSVTPFGQRLASLPVHPRLGAMLASADRVGHVERLALAAASIAERDPILRDSGPSPARETESDLADRVVAIEKFERDSTTRHAIGELHRGGTKLLLRSRNQLLRLLEKKRSDTDGSSPVRSLPFLEALGRALLAGFPDRVARRRDNDPTRAILVGGRGVRLSGQCGVRSAEFFVGLDLDAGRRGHPRTEALVRRASAVERDWFDPSHVHADEVLEWDSKREAVRLQRRTRYFDLVLESHAAKPTREHAGPAAELLVERAKTHLNRALPLDDGALSAWVARIRWLREHRPELELPAWTDEDFAALLPTIAAGRVSFAELRRAPILDAVRNSLDHRQYRALEEEAPERLQVPTGHRIALQYEPGRPPVLAVKIQELFGLRDTPRLAGGRVPVLLHLLAPNMRPQQVTDDLASFWANTYAQVRKDLRGRYPKHAWPEDPLNAPPERRPKRR